VLPAPRVATAAASEVEIAAAPTTTALAATTTAPPASPTTTPITTALAALETPTPAALDMDLFQILIGQINKINELFGFHKSFSFLSESAFSTITCGFLCDWASMSPKKV
jgi:hypothetical protein